MPTITDIIGAGETYTTPALWEDGTDNTSLVTANEIRIGACKNELFSVTSGSLVTIAGATTSPDYYRHLTTHTGASFRDNASVQDNELRYNETSGAGAALKTTGTFSTTVNIDEANFKLSKLQLSSTASNSRAIGTAGTTRTGLDVDGCIIETFSGILDAGGFSGKIRNSLIVMRTASKAYICRSQFNTIDFVNCTFVVPTDLTAATNCFEGNSGTITAKNCAMFGVTGIKTGTSSYTFTTCKGSASETGVSLVSYVNQFEAINDATRDFRLKSGADCINTGTTDSTNALVDIAGTSRPSGSAYDVGAWEFVEAEGVELTIVPRSSMKIWTYR